MRFLVVVGLVVAMAGGAASAQLDSLDPAPLLPPEVIRAEGIVTIATSMESTEGMFGVFGDTVIGIDSFSAEGYLVQRVSRLSRPAQVTTWVRDSVGRVLVRHTAIVEKGSSDTGFRTITCEYGPVGADGDIVDLIRTTRIVNVSRLVDTMITLYSYDEQGRLISKGVPGVGIEDRYTWVDSLLLRVRSIPLKPHPRMEAKGLDDLGGTFHAYDSLGRLVETATRYGADTTAKVQYEYDNSGRIILEHQFSPEGQVYLTTEQERDDDSRLIRKVVRDLRGDPMTIITYTYTDAGLPATVHTTGTFGTNTVTYHYSNLK